MMRIKMLQAVGDYARGAIVPVEDSVGRRYVAAGFAEEVHEATPAGPLLKAILADADRIRADPRHERTTPLGWAQALADVAERVAHFTAADTEDEQRANLAEVRATAIRCAALALVVATVADEGRMMYE